MTRKESPPAGCGPLPGYAGGSGGEGRTAFGKPLETMGRKATGLQRAAGKRLTATLAGLRFSKPREIAGLQSHGG